VKWRKLSTELLTDNRELLTLSMTVVVASSSHFQLLTDNRELLTLSMTVVVASSSRSQLLRDNQELLSLSTTVVVSAILVFSASHGCLVVSEAKNLLSVVPVQSLHLWLIPSVALLLFFLSHGAM